MSTNTITQKDINLLKSHNKLINIKVTLLDDNYSEVDTLTGKIKGSLSYEIDSESSIRRTSAITLVVPNKNDIPDDFEKTWNKRVVELACGIYSNQDNDYIWYNLGRMLLANGSTTVSATTQEIKLNLVDLMASMTEERGSQIGTPILITEGSVVKNVIENVVSLYSDYMITNVCNFEDTIPYDLETDIGVYPIDVLQQIIGLFPYYEMFYDVNGTFTVRPIPTSTSSPIDVPKEIMDTILISESKSTNFADIKNTTEIWGAELNGDYVAMTCEQNSGRYNVTIDETFTTLESGSTFTIYPDSDSVANQKMKIQDTAEYPIVTVNGDGTTYTPIGAGVLKAGVAYVVKYFENKYILQGELYIRCIVQEITSLPSASIQQAYKEENACNNVKWIVNPDNPFACYIKNGFIEGEIRQVLQNDEYAKIYTTELAYERASYENWLKCRMQDTVDLEIILIPWLDVNSKIEYTSPMEGTSSQWLVKSISYDFTNWTMKVKASRFYPYYPWAE